MNVLYVDALDVGAASQDKTPTKVCVFDFGHALDFDAKFTLLPFPSRSWNHGERPCQIYVLSHRPAPFFYTHT
jgi:hypothetical protein